MTTTALSPRHLIAPEPISWARIVESPLVTSARAWFARVGGAMNRLAGSMESAEDQRMSPTSIGGLQDLNLHSHIR